MPILYFDIDGVLLSYEDVQRPVLSGGAIQDRLEKLGFTRLVCVSGWSDIVNTIRPVRSEYEQKLAIHNLLNEIFPARELFLQQLELAYNTDTRCRCINLAEEWFYVDDWADKFFTAQFGEELYRQELGRRILLVNPHGDGSDILEWLDSTVREIINRKS